MELVSMKCPSCGALIYFEKDQEHSFCSHCGAQILISDPNHTKYTYSEFDAARIKEAETYESIRKKELELEELKLNREKNIIYIKIAISIFAILVAAGLIAYISHLAHIDQDFGETLSALIFTFICAAGLVAIAVFAIRKR